MAKCAEKTYHDISRSQYGLHYNTTKNMLKNILKCPNAEPNSSNKIVEKSNILHIRYNAVPSKNTEAVKQEVRPGMEAKVGDQSPNVNPPHFHPNIFVHLIVFCLLVNK